MSTTEVATHGGRADTVAAERPGRWYRIRGCGDGPSDWLWVLDHAPYMLRSAHRSAFCLLRAWLLGSLNRMLRYSLAVQDNGDAAALP